MVYHIWDFLLLKTFREHDIRPLEHGERSVYILNKGHWTFSKVRFSTLFLFICLQSCEKVCLVTSFIRGHAVAQLVEALRYKSECRGFDSRWCYWNFSLT